jgi:hypothetical protein
VKDPATQCDGHRQTVVTAAVPTGIGGCHSAHSRSEEVSTPCSVARTI